MEGELEKGMHAGIKEAKPERGDHRAPTKQRLSKIRISHSLDWSTKSKNTTQNSQKSFYSIHKLLNMISLQSETPKSQHSKTGDVL